MTHHKNENIRVTKNRELAEKWFSAEPDQKNEAVFLYLKDCLTSEDPEQIKKSAEYFCLKLRNNWRKCRRSRSRLEKCHMKWLDDPSYVYSSLNENSKLHEASSSRGRPPIPFGDASLKTKVRRVEDLVTRRSTDELLFAVERSVRASHGNAVLTNPHFDRRSKCLTPHEALALILDLNISVRKYKILRSIVNGLHENCFPSWYAIEATRKLLLPSTMTVTETSGEVQLQDLLNLSVESIFKSLTIDNNIRANLTCKWGFDGSSGHSTYKQRFNEENSTDEFVFFIGLVPLNLSENGTNNVIWSNNRPSSTLYCRPVKFIFIKESSDIIKEEEAKMIASVRALTTHTFTVGEYSIEINFKMLFTMIDGSVVNIISDTKSTSRCYICGATPVEMNKASVAEKPPKPEHYGYGLTTLHSWIRLFECLLHISYRLPIKKWQVRGSEDKEIVDKNKKEIQIGFKEKMELHVDKPKPGYGSTNNGNTARRFFAHPDMSSEITGIDKHLITDFSYILRILSSGKHINIENVRYLLNETKQLYLKLYPWFYMPVTLHKLLFHGCEVISHFELPIGILSEEALEARHKEFRKIRLEHTRKSSRIKTNTDLLNILLISSDPLISSKRRTTSKKHTDRADDEIIEKYILPDNLEENDPSEEAITFLETFRNINVTIDEESD